MMTTGAQIVAVTRMMFRLRCITFKGINDYIGKVSLSRRRDLFGNSRFGRGVHPRK